MPIRTSWPDIAAQLAAYCAQVINFRLGEDDPPAAVASQAAPSAPTRLARSLKAANRSTLLMLGLGTGSLAMETAALLPDCCRMIVCELDPRLVRHVMASGGLPAPLPAAGNPGQPLLIADTSPMAIRLLASHAGLDPEDWLAVINPELPPVAKDAYRHLLALLAAPTLTMDASSTPLAGATVGVIAHPAEPGMEEFFAHIPAQLPVVVVWDDERIPDHGLPENPLRKEIARPLAGDFSEQRNALLAACRAMAPNPWLLSIDIDERLPAAAWAALPTLMAQEDLCGYHLPRRTLYPNARTAKVGYGLWPDLQLRLFRLAPGLTYTRALHERLIGMQGPTAIALNLAFDHLNRLLKTPQQLATKFHTFDAAASGAGVQWGAHRINSEYPCLGLAQLPGEGPVSSIKLLITG